MKLRYILPLILIIFVEFILGASPLSLKIHTPVINHGSTFTATVKIDPSPDNRQLYTILDCEEYYTSSYYQLDEKSPLLYRVEYKGIPSGECVFGVILLRSEAGKVKEYRETASVVVS